MAHHLVLLVLLVVARSRPVRSGRETPAALSAASTRSFLERNATQAERPSHQRWHWRRRDGVCMMFHLRRKCGRSGRFGFGSPLTITTSIFAGASRWVREGYDSQSTLVTFSVSNLTSSWSARLISAACRPPTLRRRPSGLMTSPQSWRADESFHPDVAGLGDSPRPRRSAATSGCERVRIPRR